MSHSTEKFHRGIHLCFRKYLVSKKLKEERVREYQDFPSKNFCLAVPKNFVGESFSASLFSGIKKFYASERGEGVSRFSVEIFVSHGAEKFRSGESFSVSLILGYRKILCLREGEGVSRFPVERFLSHGAEKFRKGESFSVLLISGVEKFYASESYVTIFDFLSNFFLSHSAEKFPR